MGDAAQPIDHERVSRWIEITVGLQPPYNFEIVANGRSNLTYVVRDSNSDAFVLRRPPLGPVLPTAHDMGREYRVISALSGTPVPVPTPIALCDDVQVTGAPFYLMGHVEGHVIRTLDDVDSVLDMPARTAVSTALVEALASIHSVDPEAVGLGDLGRRDNYVARQLKRWLGQLHKSTDSDDREVGDDVAYLERAHSWLAAAIPEEASATLVHGDFRLGNCLISTDGDIRAVLDWETCTLGQPLADLAILLVGWTEADDDDLLGLAADRITPTSAEGFADRSGIVDLYENATGRDVSDLPFYYAFAWWRMACVLHGVAARYHQGAGGGETAGQETMLFKARGATETARRALIEAGLNHDG
ncbi:phosphotransferase family protein [Aeromicrobium panaciterrae]